MFDTGALIALERGHLGIRKLHRAAVEAGIVVAVTTPVIAEWWRKGKRENERRSILRALVTEPPDAHVARLAGEAVGLVHGTGVVDALVMAAASLRGDTVYTSDFDDLERLSQVFTNVHVERV
jgi:predicted nucleic acid-binding protein